MLLKYKIVLTHNFKRTFDFFHINRIDIFLKVYNKHALYDIRIMYHTSQ